MSQSAARTARRHGLPTAGLGGEITADAIDESRRRMRGARGAEPVKVVTVEQVEVVGGGHKVMLTVDTPEGRRAFLFDPDEADVVGSRFRELAGSAKRGLYLAGS